MNHDEAKINCLEELIEEMRSMDGDKLKPKAVEIEMTTMKPKSEDETMGESPMVALGKTDDIVGHGESSDGDELSPEDMAILDHMYGNEDEHEEEK